MCFCAAVYNQQSIHVYFPLKKGTIEFWTGKHLKYLFRGISIAAYLIVYPVLISPLPMMIKTCSEQHLALVIQLMGDSPFGQPLRH